MWPDVDTRARIAKCSLRLPRKRGKPVAVENLHITLAFIGMVDGDTRACLESQGGALQAPQFELVLDQFGYFPKPKVLWLGVSHRPQALGGLVAGLNTALAPCGYQAEARPFHPHVTLFRKAEPAAEPAAAETIHWLIDHFSLVESVTDPGGVRYKVIRDYPLDA